MSESMPSTRPIPAIKSLGVGGWVSVNRSVLTCSLEVTVLPSMTRQAGGAVEFAGMEPKQMSMGLARMSAMLSRKITSLAGAIELHEEPWILPLPGAPYQLSDGEIYTAHRGINPCGLVVRRGGI
jgi:hypothetical protein